MTRRGYATLTDLNALIDGVPNYMANSLEPWLTLMLTEPVTTGSSYRQARSGRVLWLERKLRRDLGGSSNKDIMVTNLMYRMNQNDDLKLDIINALLEEYGDDAIATPLDMVLLESGSKWTARKGPDNIYALEERVDSVMTDSYDEITSKDTTTSRYLKEAWSEAFGRDPKPSRAYSASVKAVEAASWPVVLPNNQKATLGDIIRELESNNTDWTTSIAEKTLNLGVQTVIDQCKLIWQGQTDRHGTSSPKEPSQTAAEQVVFTSIGVCQLFDRGIICKV